MIANVCRQNMKALVGAYCKATGDPLRKVSMKFYGNQQFFADFHRGSVTMTLQKYDAVIRKFQESWPEGAEWPDLQPVIFPTSKAAE